MKVIWSFSGGSGGKDSAFNVGNLCLIPGWGRSPGKGNGYPLQYSCLEDPMDRGQATVHRVTGVRHDLVTKPPLVSQQRAHVPEAQKTKPWHRQSAAE